MEVVVRPVHGPCAPVARRLHAAQGARLAGERPFVDADDTAVQRRHAPGVRRARAGPQPTAGSTVAVQDPKPIER